MLRRLPHFLYYTATHAWMTHVSAPSAKHWSWDWFWGPVLVTMILTQRLLETDESCSKLVSFFQLLQLAVVYLKALTR